MKQQVILFLLLWTAGLINAKGQALNTLSISGGIGTPLGKANYLQNHFSDAALFSNYATAKQIEMDMTFKSPVSHGYGIFIRWNKFTAWNANHISNRFSNSSLSTLDIGPLFYFNVPKFTKDRMAEKIIIVPFISYINLVNKESMYSISTDETLMNSQSSALTFQKGETYSHISQFLPGVYVAYDWSLFINEKASIFVRPGLTFMMTKPVGYPDKYVIMPSVSIGYTFDDSRNKWFFIKKMK